MKAGLRVVVQTPEGLRYGGVSAGPSGSKERPTVDVLLDDGPRSKFKASWVFAEKDVRKAWIFEDSKLVRIVFWSKPNAVTLGPCIFMREKAHPSLLRHELIHVMQARELLWLGFFIAYILFALVGALRTLSMTKGTLHNPFEQEGYRHATEVGYLHTRARYNWRRYV